MDEEVLMRTCLTQLAALGHSFEESDGYYVDVNRNYSTNDWNVEITLEWDTSYGWISAANCTITDDLKVTKCALLEKDEEGDVIEKIRYPDAR
jgi:hypothetical protein